MSLKSVVKQKKPLAVASDLYPFVHQFLVQCGLRKSASQFQEEAKLVRERRKCLILGRLQISIHAVGCDNSCPMGTQFACNV